VAANAGKTGTDLQLPRVSLSVFHIALPTLHTYPVLGFEEINKGYFGGVSLGGYDAVSYFTSSKAVAVNKAYAVEWKGATWLFSSAANRVLFKTNPEA